MTLVKGFCDSIMRCDKQPRSNDPWPTYVLDKHALLVENVINGISWHCDDIYIIASDELS